MLAVLDNHHEAINNDNVIFSSWNWLLIVNVLMKKGRVIFQTHKYNINFIAYKNMILLELVSL